MSGVFAIAMAQIASAYPTAGGPYWWAARLGGPGWSWFTGWFNVIGLLAVVASVDYAAAKGRIKDALAKDAPKIRQVQLAKELSDRFRANYLKAAELARLGR
mgnify:CR=1 FL=1